MDLFTQNIGRKALHKASNTLCLVVAVEWYLNSYHYTLAVPQKDSKGKIMFCNATYTEKEIEVIK